MTNWIQLPPEIRLCIFEFLATHPGGNPRKPLAPPSKKSGFACYASVAKEWQLFFEPRLYANLRVSQYCLDEFEVLIHRQREMVRHVWFRFRLSPYSCLTCRDSEAESPQKHDGKRLAIAVGRLFKILSKWELCGAGITLEISATSPSETAHSFKGNVYLDANSNELEDMKLAAAPHDPGHGWFEWSIGETPLYHDSFQIGNTLLHEKSTRGLRASPSDYKFIVSPNYKICYSARHF